MIWVDYVILAIIGISAGIGLVRGLVREALSLAGWVAAIWAGYAFSDQVAAMLVDEISTPSLREAVAFFAVFAAVLLVTAIVLQLVDLVVEKTGLSGTDRMLGMVFGVGRGAVVVAILVLLAGLTALPRDPWWRQSTLLPHFETLAGEIRSLLPPEFASHFDFAPAPAPAPAPPAGDGGEGAPART